MSRHELIALAKTSAALHGRGHLYTQGSGFEPHEWVILAMEEAYNRGSESPTDSARREAYLEGYDDGYAQAEADRDD